jgi:fatty-acyl-CoA synthase
MKKSYVHRGGETPLLGETIGDHVDRIAARWADREALVSLPQRLRWTYRDLAQNVDELAKGLIGLGVKRGERVGIWSTNNAQWIQLQLATAKVGAILVNVNPANRVPELEYALRAAKVSTLFLIPHFRTSNYVSMMHQVDVPDVVRRVVFNPANPRATERPDLDFQIWPQVIEAGRSISDELLRRRAATLDPDDPINIQFTSGTTGHPKGVVLSHHNILNNGFFVGEAMKLSELDRVCVPVPFYHCFGMVVSTMAAVTHGSALVIPAEHFDAGATLRAVSQERCTVLHGVPTMFLAELEHPDFKTADRSTLRTGIMAGAPCAPELVRRVIDELGIRELLIGYGQTEASPVTHSTSAEDPLDKRTETVGRSLPHQECKIVDFETGDLAPVGSPGEVCVRGYNVMRGYFGMEPETRKTIDPARWLHTGDIGVMDEGGYVRITGRLKDMIKRGGENVYPAEVEAFYMTHPQVAQVAVFGVPDPKMGEEVGAWIKLRDGAHADAESFREFARGKLAHFKIPKHIWFVTEFPMTVTGKIQKFKIRETAQACLRLC